MGIFKKLIPSMIADAHCDVPCGIYDPTPAKIASMTVLRMVGQINELKPPANPSDSHEMGHYTHMMARRVATKEEHAQKCKTEVAILWSDFFKSEHLTKYPNLHDLIWKTLKLCSKNKQDVDEQSAKDLNASVDEIAKIFYDVKGDSARFDAYKAITDKLF